MGLLNNFVAFLSGPIDHANDDGLGFRRSIKEHCEHFKLGIRWLDPTDKPVGFTNEIADEKRLLNDLAQDGKWDELSKHCNDFVIQDERMVQQADFIIGYIDTKIHMCGTYDEILQARQQNKPVYLIIAGGKKNCPKWIFGKFPWQEMFDSIEDLIKHLLELNLGYTPLDKRWIMRHDLLPI